MDILEKYGVEKESEQGVSNLDTKYLIAQVGAPLTKALGEIALKQPQDPIEYLSGLLFKYRDNQLELKKEKEQLKLMMEAEIEKMKKLACIEEEKRLVRKRRKAILEEKRREKQRQAEEARKRQEEEKAREKILQSPEKKDENGQTALHRIAAEKDADFTHLDKMSVLLAERDVKFRTPRDIAQEMGYDGNVTEIDKHVLSLLRKEETTILKRLLMNGYEHFQAALDLKSQSEMFPDMSNMFITTITDMQEQIANVFLSVQDKDEETTEKLIDLHPQLTSSKNNRGHTLLHVAILVDNISAVKIILEANPETVNMTDNFNRTPLHLAFALSEPISEILLESEAIDSLLDLLMKTPFDYKTDPSEILKLKEYYKSNSPKVETEPEAEPVQIAVDEPNDEEEAREAETPSMNPDES